MNRTTIPLVITVIALLPGTLPAAPNFSPMKSAVAAQRTQSFGQSNHQQQKAPATSTAIRRLPAVQNRRHLPAIQPTRRGFTPHGTAFRPFGAKANIPSVQAPAAAGLRRKALPPIHDRIPQRPDSSAIPGNDSAAPDPFDRGQPDSPAGSRFDTSSPTDKLGKDVTTGRDFEDAQGAIHDNAAQDRTGGARLGWTSNDPGVRTPDQGQASDGATKTITIKEPIEITASRPRSLGGDLMEPDTINFIDQGDGESNGPTIIDVSPTDPQGNVTITVVVLDDGVPARTTVYYDVTPEDLDRARRAITPAWQPNPEDDSAAPLLSFFEPDVRQSGKKTRPKDLVSQPGDDPAGISSESNDIRPNVGLEAVINPGDSSYSPSTPGSNNGPDIGGTLPDPEGTPVANQ